MKKRGRRNRHRRHHDHHKRRDRKPRKRRQSEWETFVYRLFRTIKRFLIAAGRGFVG